MGWDVGGLLFIGGVVLCDYWLLENVLVEVLVGLGFLM